MPIKTKLWVAVLKGVRSRLEPAEHHDAKGAPFAEAKKSLLGYLRQKRDLFSEAASDTYHLTESHALAKFRRAEREP